LRTNASRELLLDNEPFVVHGLVLEAWLDVAQRSRVLHVSFGRRRQRGRVRSFLSRMPSLAALVEGRQSAQPLADVEIVLIHHITSEVIGVISALRELGCRSLSTLFVAYAGEAPGSYLGPILDLPEEEFTGYALSRIPRLAAHREPLPSLSRVFAHRRTPANSTCASKRRRTSSLQ
jgi:hypothetical protein